MSKLTTCPLCRRGRLREVDRSPEQTIYHCQNRACDKLIEWRTPYGKAMQIVVPGVTIISGLPSILEFFGVADMDELIDKLSDLI